LRNHGIATGRQWRVDVDALKLMKTYKFYEYCAEDPPFEVDENV
jgi:hypothetical protein